MSTPSSRSSTIDTATRLRATEIASSTPLRSTIDPLDAPSCISRKRWLSPRATSSDPLRTCTPISFHMGANARIDTTAPTTMSR